MITQNLNLFNVFLKLMFVHDFKAPLQQTDTFTSHRVNLHFYDFDRPCTNGKGHPSQPIMDIGDRFA